MATLRPHTATFMGKASAHHQATLIHLVTPLLSSVATTPIRLSGRGNFIRKDIKRSCWSGFPNNCFCRIIKLTRITCKFVCLQSSQRFHLSISTRHQILSVEEVVERKKRNLGGEVPQRMEKAL